MKPNRRHEGLKKAKRILWRFKIPPVLRRYWGNEVSNACEERTFQNLTNTRTACSGSCCGNPRRWRKQKTRQEILAELDEKEQVEEYYSGVV